MRWIDRAVFVALALGVWALVLKPSVPVAGVPLNFQCEKLESEGQVFGAPRRSQAGKMVFTLSNPRLTNCR